MSRTSPVLERPPTVATESSRGRLVFVDVLRVAVIAMVIVHHAAQAYGPTGSVWPVTDPTGSDWFRPFFTVNAAVGLGLLFLLAGYFVPRSYDRKGPGRFLKERWGRIGVPLVLFGLAVNLPIVYLYESRPALGKFVRSLYEDGLQGIYFHLWFLGDLLLYTAVYVAWRRVANRAERPRRTWPPPNHPAIAGFVVGLALVTWIVRWWYPVDEWVPLLFVVPAEPANMPQYVSLFALGIVAYRSDWFRRIPTRVGMTWLGVGLVASAAVYALEAFGLWGDPRAVGGFNWPSLLRTSLEALIGAGLSVGLVVLFREVFRRPRRLLAAMATASYAAYILHLYIVVGLQGGILGLEAPAVVKFALVAVLGTFLSFGIAHLSRRVPGVRVILGTTPERHRTEPARSEQPVRA